MIPVFRTFSIRRKLMAIMLAITGVVMVVVSLAFVINEVIVSRKKAGEELTALADILANNSAAAVAFNDQNAAAEILPGLKAKP